MVYDRNTQYGTFWVFLLQVHNFFFQEHRMSEYHFTFQSIDCQAFSLQIRTFSIRSSGLHPPIILFSRKQTLKQTLASLWSLSNLISLDNSIYLFRIIYMATQFTLNYSVGLTKIKIQYKKKIKSNSTLSPGDNNPISHFMASISL